MKQLSMFDPFDICLRTGEIASVDPIDADLATMTWRIGTDGYARNNTRTGGEVRLHRLIMERVLGRSIEPKEWVDHVNRNKLDNRRCNLRMCTQSQNNYNQKRHSNNKSGYKGVSWNKQKNKWQSKIKVEKKLKYLGLFNDPEMAHKAYCEAAIKYHGEFARFE